MNYLINAIGRKGVLVSFVFIVAALVTVFGAEAVVDDRYTKFLDFALYVTGVFAGANVFEHFAKKGK